MTGEATREMRSRRDERLANELRDALFEIGEVERTLDEVAGRNVAQGKPRETWEQARAQWQVSITKIRGDLAAVFASYGPGSAASVDVSRCMGAAKSAREMADGLREKAWEYEASTWDDDEEEMEQ
jgi:hypothetical protein